MKLSEVTLEDFLTDDCEITGAANTTLDMFLPLLKDAGWYQGEERPIEGSTEFATAPVNRAGIPMSLGQQVLLQRDGKSWKIVGMYIDEALFVSDDIRKKGLGAELVTRCAEHRAAPTRRTVSIIGLATLQSAHRKAIDRAINAGQTVPQRVLDDYPRLARKH